MSTEQSRETAKTTETRVRIPSEVTLALDGSNVIVRGPLGTVQKNVSHMPVDLKVQEGELVALTKGKSRRARAMIGTTRSIIASMINGVTRGYTYRMKVVSSHFPVTVKVSGKEVLIENFIGERFSRRARILGDTKVEVKDDEITITGLDKYSVGQTAANIEQIVKIPRKDPRKFLDGIYVIEKG